MNTVAHLVARDPDITILNFHQVDTNKLIVFYASFSNKFINFMKLSYVILRLTIFYAVAKKTKQQLRTLQNFEIVTPPQWQH